MLFLHQQPNYFKKGLVLFFVLSVFNNAYTFGLPSWPESLGGAKKEELSMEWAEVNIEGIAKRVPAQLKIIIDQLNRQLPHQVITEFKNRVLLHGPTGNGKTTYAYAIARATNSELLEIAGPDVVNSYVGSGPTNINLIIQQADEYVSKGKKVVIFLDEVDAFARKERDSEGRQYSTALQKLWLHMDKKENSSHYIFVAATNDFKNLMPQFVKRFEQNNIIEINNPDIVMRREIIEFYVQQKQEIYPNFKIDETYLNKLVTDSKDLSVRDIKDLITAVYRDQMTMKLALSMIAGCKATNNNKKDDNNKGSMVPTVISTVAVSINTIINLVEFVDKCYNGDMKSCATYIAKKAASTAANAAKNTGESNASANENNEKEQGKKNS